MNKVVFTMRDGSKKEFDGEKFTDEHLIQFRKGNCHRFNCCEECPLAPGKDCHTRIILDDVAKVERVVDLEPRFLSGCEVDAHLKTFCGLDSRELMSAIEHARRHGWKPKPKKVKKTFYFCSFPMGGGLTERYTSNLFKTESEAYDSINGTNKPDVQVHSIEVEVEDV